LCAQTNNRFNLEIGVFPLSIDLTKGLSTNIDWFVGTG
jgi:hypothetical protein